MPKDEKFLDTLSIELAPSGYAATCGFDCGEKDLTDYICDGTSASDEQAGVSRSYLVRRDDHPGIIVGYFTVLADSIRLEMRERPKGMVYPSAPAVKLGRMGVSIDYKGRGVGPWILQNVVGLAVLMGEKVGVRYITLDALPRPKLVAMYASFGFVTNKGETKAQKLIRNIMPPKELPHVSMRFDIRL